MNPFFTSIRLENYRGLDRGELKGLSLVNLVSGLNGAGKTTFLEAAFIVLDRFGGPAFLRPLIFRNLPIAVSLAGDFLFSHSDRREMPAQIVMKTRDGEIRYKMRWERQMLPNSPVVNKVSTASVTSGDSSPFGVTVESFLDNQLQLKRGFFDVPGGIQLVDHKVVQAVVPIAVMLTKTIVASPQVSASRFTAAVQSNQKKRLIEFARIVIPEIVDLQLLQISDSSYLYAELISGQLIALPFAGDGAATMIAVALAIMSSRDGVVFLDEFDTAIHYSKLEESWGAIVALALECNCQILAATHSLECIEGALQGAQSVGHEDAFRFHRLDRIANSTDSVCYGPGDIREATAERWDVR